MATKKATKDKVKSTTRNYTRDALGRFARTSDSGSFKGTTKARSTKIPVTATKVPKKDTVSPTKGKRLSAQAARESAIGVAKKAAKSKQLSAESLAKAVAAKLQAVTQKDSDPTGLKKTRAKKDTTKTKDKAEVKRSVKKATKTAVATTQGKLLTERLDRAYAKNEAVGQAISKKQSATVAAVKQARKAGDDTTADKLKATLPKLLEQETRNSKRYHQLRRLDPRLNSDLKDTVKPVKETAKQTKAKAVGKAEAVKAVAKKSSEPKTVAEIETSLASRASAVSLKDAPLAVAKQLKSTVDSAYSEYGNLLPSKLDSVRFLPFSKDRGVDGDVFGMVHGTSHFLVSTKSKTPTQLAKAARKEAAEDYKDSSKLTPAEKAALKKGVQHLANSHLSDKDYLKGVVHHELGHVVYNRLPEGVKRSFNDVASKHPISVYSLKNKDEMFAEQWSAFVMKDPTQSEEVKKILRKLKPK
jgi:hypothetical protein